MYSQLENRHFLELPKSQYTPPLKLQVIEAIKVIIFIILFLLSLHSEVSMAGYEYEHTRHWQKTDGSELYVPDIPLSARAIQGERAEINDLVSQ